MNDDVDRGFRCGHRPSHISYDIVDGFPGSVFLILSSFLFFFLLFLPLAVDHNADRLVRMLLPQCISEKMNILWAFFPLNITLKSGNEKQTLTLTAFFFSLSPSLSHTHTHTHTHTHSYTRFFFSFSLSLSLSHKHNLQANTTQHTPHSVIRVGSDPQSSALNTSSLKFTAKDRQMSDKTHRQ